MLNILLVEDNDRLRPALRAGLDATEAVHVTDECTRGEDAAALCNARKPDAVLMDVQLAGNWNGIATAVALRREWPRLPVVFYSIQDDDDYYRQFRKSGILSHYAYVRKSNYLLPQMIVPLLQDAFAGKSFIDPDIEERVQQVQLRDESSPLDYLEPNEQAVAKLLSLGLTNEQIAARLGFKDKRTIARVNGQIYTSWSLNDSETDEKVARLRAALIYRAGRFIEWDKAGEPRVQDDRGQWIEWTGN